MRTAHTHIRTPRLGRVVAGLAVALAVGAAATPALADNDRHRGHRGGHHGDHQGHNKHHGHYGQPAPVYYYAPPSAYYAPRVYYAPPRPVYYYPPPSPGLTLVFPLNFD